MNHYVAEIVLSYSLQFLYCCCGLYGPCSRVIYTYSTYSGAVFCMRVCRL